MSKKVFHIVSLGCAKNTVDSDAMAQLLAEAGYRATDRSTKADIIIVNTCGFIGPAREESLQVLGEFAQKKRQGQRLIAAGCMTQRYGSEVAQQVPGIDGILGTRRWMDIVEVVEKAASRTQSEPHYHLPDSPTIGVDTKRTVQATIQGGSAYLKIADGCRRPCAFCAIPLIKGTTISRPTEDILQDAKFLQEQGVQELILIAQDTTDYGHDLGIKDGLAQLLEKLITAAPEIPWIRIMYAYPGYVTDRLINIMADHPRILPYLDIPLQHAHPDILRQMKRPSDMDWVYRTLEKMRHAIPGLALRTTFIVGYPGETEIEFKTLLDFIAATRFDRVGVFQFSYEPGTASEALGDPIPAELKQERWEQVMALQERISLEKNLELVGKKLDILIEGRDNGISVGRSYRDAPEIDGLVIVQGEAEIGKIVPVMIDGAMNYDLTGCLI
jgi:ribosomal protein S12 methylthiotransferase